MIPRYTRPAMAAIWSEEAKLRQWLRVELAVVDAWTLLGKVPQEARDAIHARAAFSVERTQEIERETRHDVIAFLTDVAEHVGEESRFIHLGMTSSDVLDTGLALQIQEAAELLYADFDALLSVLERRAREFKDTLQIGRSHGIHAEPITFGWKLALWYAEVQRAQGRVQGAAGGLRVGKISGAVGTWAQVSPDLERIALEKLGLDPAPVSSQIIQRDRHAAFLTALALAGATIEKIAVELRHLQRTEVAEVQEGFAPGQKGSSAMPHKRNPITGEQLSGLARILRGNALAAMENVALWHERDISHSSVERVIFPDSCILLDYMLAKCTHLLEHLVVDADRMMRILEMTQGVVFSQRLMLYLVERGVSREDAYPLVQKAAHMALDTATPFKEVVRATPQLAQHLSDADWSDLFDYGHFVRYVDKAFERVFNPLAFLENEDIPT
ncbi:MAG TPA: adenylosuccinate lyase [bacterium]|nr:adenylosuccinate lyase [bacterium]